MGYKQQVTRPGLDGAAGFMVKRPNQPHRTTMPSWEQETQFRVFPRPKPDGGFHPIRASVDDDDFGEAVWAEPVVKRLGVQEQFTYPVRIPGLQGDSPTVVLTQALLALIKDKKKDLAQRGFADWIDWPEGGKGRSARLMKPSDAIFYQGATVMARGKPFVNKVGQPAPQYPSLLMGTVSLRMGFEQIGNARVVNAQGVAYTGPAPESIGGNDEASRKQRDAIYAAMFQIGDWCSIEHGHILRIFQAPPAQGGFDKPHYAIALGQEFPLVGAEDLVRRNWVPWEELIWYHSAEEQVQLLCRAFPPEAVDYALNGSPYTDLLPANVKGAWRTQQMPAAQWQGAGIGAPQPQPTQWPGATPAAPQPQVVAPAPQPQLAAQMTLTPQAPLPATAAPAPQPTSTALPAAAPMLLGGMDMSGSGTIPDEVDTSLAEAGGFAHVAELQQPVTAAPMSLTPQQLHAPAPGNATPAAAAPIVPPDKLNAAIAQLRSQRTGGNPAGR